MTTLRGSGPAPHGYVRCASPDCASEGSHYHPQRHPEIVPREDGAGDRADLRPGFYYVSIEHNGERRLVRGPWSSHAAALAAVAEVRAHCERIDPRGAWYAYGTARSETDLGPGLLGPAVMGQ